MFHVNQSQLGEDSPPKPLLIVEDGTHPVILFLHGTCLQNSYYAQLFEHIASHGYMLVAPQLYGCTERLHIIFPWELDIPKHQYMEIQNSSGQHKSQNGHSRGGKTAFALALGKAKTSLQEVNISALLGVDPVAGLGKECSEPIILRDEEEEEAEKMGSPLGTTNIDTEMHNLRTNLFKSAMRGEWNKVVASYRVNPKSYSAQITRSGDTSLHLAVRDGQEDIVEELLKLMSSHPDEAKAALEIANDQKNTALHLAAAGGTARMCSCIANLEPSLIGQRNGEGETPLFWAALHGKKETFFCLHSICGVDQGRSYYRRTCDGDTILHVAIAGEFFDLAFQIIYLYEELANTHNQKGITPLHLLASKPNAFRSGTHLGAYQKMIYHCIFVEELKMEEISNQSFSVTASNNNSKPTYPENYEACMDILLLIKKGYEFGKYK